jgi:hypothetical protein
MDDNKKTLSEGWHLLSQTPIDDRIILSTYNELLDLGVDNVKAFRYYEGLKIFVLENESEYIWTESVEGVLSTPYTYPNSIVTNGTDYSNKTFNLVKSNFAPSIVDVDVYTTGNISNLSYVNPGNPNFPARKAILSSNNPSVFPTYQGITPFLGMKVLVKDQTDKTKNGYYKLTKLGNTVNQGWELKRIAYLAEDHYPRFWMIKNGPDARKIFTQFTPNLISNQIGVTGDIIFGFINDGINTIQVTHAELVNFVSTSVLIPGGFYKITDFATMYEQPDFGTTKAAVSTPVVKTAAVDPIIVMATGNDKLSTSATQESYPNDKLEYELIYTTPKTSTPTKGRITNRVDEYNNKTDYDHRTILFKRYYDSLTSDYTSYYNTSHVNGAQEFLTFPVPTTVSERSYNNELLGYDQTNRPNTFDLPNTIFMSKGNYENYLPARTYNNTFKTVAIRNTVNFACYNNVVNSVSFIGNNLSNFYENFIQLSGAGAGFEFNQSANAFNRNTILGAKFKQNIFDNFYLNTTNTNAVETNNIVSFHDNIININFTACNMVYFFNNTVNDDLLNPGSIFSKSLFSSGLTNCTFSGGFSFCTGTAMDNCTFSKQVVYLNISGTILNTNFSTATLIYTVGSKDIIKIEDVSFSDYFISYRDKYGAILTRILTA